MCFIRTGVSGRIFLCVYWSFLRYTVYVMLFFSYTPCVGKCCSRGEAGNKHVHGTRTRVAKELFVLLFISAAAAASATDVSACSVTDSGDGGHAPVGRPTLLLYSLHVRLYNIYIYYYFSFTTLRDGLFCSVIFYISHYYYNNLYLRKNIINK